MQKAPSSRLHRVVAAVSMLLPGNEIPSFCTKIPAKINILKPMTGKIKQQHLQLQSLLRLHGSISEMTSIKPLCLASKSQLVELSAVSILCLNYTNFLLIFIRRMSRNSNCED